MLQLLVRPPTLSQVRTVVFSYAPQLGCRRFSRQAGSPPPQGWVPTPYVTETIVRYIALDVIGDGTDLSGGRLADP